MQLIDLILLVKGIIAFQTVNGNLNGALLRDDLPSNFYLKFPDEFSLNKQMSDFLDAVNAMNQDQIVRGRRSVTTNNEESVDQTVYIILGLAMTIKLVDNSFVKPRAYNQGFYIIDEAKSIMKRILDYEKDKKEEVIGGFNVFGDHIDVSRVQNWRIFNPISNLPVHTGDMNGMIYPMAKTVNRYSGSSFDPTIDIPLLLVLKTLFWVIIFQLHCFKAPYQQQLNKPSGVIYLQL
jgi:hypothetical protein